MAPTHIHKIENIFMIFSEHCDELRQIETVSSTNRVRSLLKLNKYALVRGPLLFVNVCGRHVKNKSIAF